MVIKSMRLTAGIYGSQQLLIFIPPGQFFLGELDKALEHFTAAVLANPNSAPLYAKRARYFTLSVSLFSDYAKLLWVGHPIRIN